MAEDFDINLDEPTVDVSFPEIMHEDNFPVTEKTPTKTGIDRKQIIIFVSIGAAVLLSLIGLIIGLFVFSGRSTDDDRILQNVFAAGVDLSGMTVEEAISALHVATDHNIAQDPMEVRIFDDSLILNPADVNLSLDVDALAQAAYDYGRNGTHAENQQIQKNAHKRSYTIPLLPYLNLDLQAIQLVVDNYCASIVSEYTEPVITTVGTRPVYGDPSPKHQSIRITLGTPLRRLDRDDLYDRILDAYSMNELLVEYDAPEILWPSAVNAQDLFDQYCTLPQDAVLDTTTYSVIPETYGYGFQIDTLTQMLSEAQPGETIEITLSFLEPAVLAEDLNDNLFSETLSECSITGVVDENARDANLQLSCQAISGYIIKPGETFSFLDALGKISAETGYAEASICGNNGIAMGGGISQTASALYHCVLHSDLEIVEHHNHTYATDFIELGLDAYVDSGSKDLRFRNNTDSPICIEASVSRHTVSVSFVGSADLPYRISIRTEITSKELPLTTYQMFIPDNAQGYVDGDVIVKGLEGYKVAVHKEKTDLSTGSTLSTSSVSVNEYQKRDEIIARIGVFTEEEPEQPEQPEQSEQPEQPEQSEQPEEITDTP